jgi:hypothetical protein
MTGSSIVTKFSMAVRMLLTRMNTPIAVMHSTLAKSSEPSMVSRTAGTNTSAITHQHRLSSVISTSKRACQ